MEHKSRDSFFDNLKGLLIVLVVFGHLIELLPRSSSVQYVYLLVYSFHMPLFVFCTGYFSVNLSPKKALRTLLYPYAVWQTLYYLFYVFVLKINSLTPSFVNPIWLMWYLLSAFLWFFLRTLFQAQTRTGVLLSVALAFALGILVGFDSSVHRYLSLSRTLVFFPFYLCGYYYHTRGPELARVRRRLNASLDQRFPIFSPDSWERKLRPALFTLLFLCGMLCLSVLWTKLDGNWFYEADAYASGGKQALFRMCHYALAIAISLFLLLVCPKKRTFLSAAGENSVVVFLLHGFLVRFLDGRIPSFILTLPPWASLPATLAFTLFITILLGNSAVKRLLSPTLHFPIPRSVPDSSPS